MSDIVLFNIFLKNQWQDMEEMLMTFVVTTDTTESRVKIWNYLSQIQDEM